MLSLSLYPFYQFVFVLGNISVKEKNLKQENFVKPCQIKKKKIPLISLFVNYIQSTAVNSFSCSVLPIVTHLIPLPLIASLFNYCCCSFKFLSVNIHAGVKS